MTDSKIQADIATATLRQRQAADPRENVFVSANAGSGKTRVLVDRVSRLLLGGVKPDKILCLTFTKAAASEMQDRLFDTLGKWSIMDDESLAQTLVKLDGQPHHNLSQARQLFAQALETPEGLKVQTIHAFCERLLRRFPIEAGIAPGYEALDDQQSAKIMATVKEQVAQDMIAQPQGALSQAHDLLSAKYANDGISGIYNWAFHNGHKVQDWAEIGLTPLAQYLGIEETLSSEQAQIDAWNGAPLDAIKSAANALAQSGKTNQKTAQLIYDALELRNQPLEAYAIYETVFLTANKAPRANVTTSKVAIDLFGGKHCDGYGHEAERMIAAIDHVKSARALELTRAIFTVTRSVADRYLTAKRHLRKMDFADMVMLSRDLLKDSPHRAWVLYKLDNGVEHILVDEAQDTSPEQWDIIDRISAEFTAIENSTRTKFAVGDEKQSIYSFQGARPQLFLDRFQDETLRNEDARKVSMDMSFRSAPEILRMVDSVFIDCQASAELFEGAPAGDLSEHKASRPSGGRVELWPITPPPETGEDEDPWDFQPVDAAGPSSREALASTLALKIKHWLDTGEQVRVKDAQNQEVMRAIRPGDIMILVRKRSPFFNAIIRHLKLKGVAVAGADKLKLTENIGVKDLISLGKFIALPSDDLSLAEVLKSPIFGLDDEELIALTDKREGRSLWEQLNQSSISPNCIEARGVLRRIVDFAPKLAPYEFYARVLSTLMPTQDGQEPHSVLRRLYARLGVEAADPIDAFLSRALAHQRSGPPSLDRFLREMAGDGSVLKREMDAKSSAVRVMTVHGSKGLEAPVVILPDTTTGETSSSSQFDMDALEGQLGFCAQVPSKERSEPLNQLENKRKSAQQQEALRLLYVGMTRAESRLVICGFHNGAKNKELKEGCWYHWALRAFEALGEQIQTEDDSIIGTLRAYGQRETGAKDSAALDEKMRLEDWAKTIAPKPSAITRRVTPSHLISSEDEMPAMRSPLDIMKARSNQNHNPFARGIAIHKLLEILPNAIPSRRHKIAQDYLDLQPEMTPDEKSAIAAEVFGVLDNPDFATLFASGSRAEVSLAGTASGLPPNIYMNAQIDRLAVTDNEVWIVDYKSNRPPPNRAEDVAQIYIGQMAAYRALAREIYPKHQIRCALLWTDVPKLMELPSALLDEFNLRSTLTAGA